MKKLNKVISSFLLLSIAAGQVHAGLPSVFMNVNNRYWYPNRTIVNPTGITIVASADDNDPKKASQDAFYYVPNRVQMNANSAHRMWSTIILNRQGNGRGGMCDALDMRIDTYRAINARLYATATNTGPLRERLESLRNALDLAASQRATACGEQDAINGRITAARTWLTNYSTEMNSAQINAQTCVIGLGTASTPASIDQCRNQVTNLQQTYLTTLQSLTTLQTQLLRLPVDCQIAENNLSTKRQAVQNLESQLSDYENLINTSQRVAASLKEFAQISGGMITGIWDDGYQAAKIRFENDNTGATLMRLPSRLLNIYLTTPVPSGSHSGAGTTMTDAQLFSDITYSGQSLMESRAINSDIATQRAATGPGASLVNNASAFAINANTNSGTGGAFTGHLTVIGGCTLLQNSGGLSLAATIIYPSSATTEVSARVNKWKVYEKIQRAGTRSSGFLGLSRTAYNETVEHANGDDGSFSFDLSSNDPYLVAADEDRIKETLKRELFERILRATFTPSAAPGLPNAPGARVSAPSIFGLPVPGIAGSVAFWTSAVDNIFGSSSSESTLRSNWNTTVTEHWTSNRIVPQVATYTVDINF